MCFYCALESREGVIPLVRKVVKVAARFVERPAVELPHPLAAAADAVREEDRLRFQCLCRILPCSGAGTASAHRCALAWRGSDTHISLEKRR